MGWGEVYLRVVRESEKGWSHGYKKNGDVHRDTGMRNMKRKMKI